jgi:hypothetical protein
MKILGIYSFNRGNEVIKQKYPDLLDEVNEVIKRVNASKCKIKKSQEKTMPGQILYSPVALNEAFKREFTKLSWQSKRVACEYPTQYYIPGFTPPKLNKGAFREIDFIKRKLGIEVQFGKYAFMVYNVCAKMTIFKKLGFIDEGIEIVPVKSFVDYMSSGVSYFEQFVWDLEQRGVSNIDIPVLILGVDK